MKLTEAQKTKRLYIKLKFQRRCPHFEVEQNKDNLFQCDNCNKIFSKDEKWHGHTYEEMI